MMRRRFYGEAPLEAFPLVAPVHEDGTYLTPDEIAAKLGSVNIIDKYNQSGIPNKKYAYTINNSLESFTTPNIAGDFLYHEKVNGIEQTTKYGQNEAITPTSGSTDRYVVACGEMTTSICQNGGEWVFSGKTNALNCEGSNEVKFAHYNKLNSYTFKSTTQIIDLVLGDKISFCNNFSYSKVVTAFLPKNITEIRGGSFLFTSLNTIYINSKYIRITGIDSFNYLFTMKNIYFAGSLEDWMNCDFTYSVGGANNRTPKLYLNGDRENYTSDFIVPSSIKIIKPFVFRCIYTDTITLHEEVTEISSDAMSWNNIKEINIPKSVAKIGNLSFYGTLLVNVTLNWTDEILPFNSQWYLGSKERTLNVPLGYVQNYIDAGYLYNESTNTSGFGTITDGETTITWDTYQL